MRARYSLAALALWLWCSSALAQGLPQPIVHGSSSGSGVTGSVFAVAFTFIGAPVGASKQSFTCPYILHFPANFTNPTTVASCGTNPSEGDGYSLKVNGTLIGTIALSTSCATSLSTISSTPKVCQAGQRLEIDVPGVVSGADIGISVAFTR